MDFFNKIPVMDRTALRELKKGIDSSFKEFSRAYVDTEMIATVAMQFFHIPK